MERNTLDGDDYGGEESVNDGKQQPALSSMNNRKFYR